MPTKRIPLTGVYNTRPGTQALTGESGIVGIGIVGQMIVGSTNAGSDKDHRMINCFHVTQSDIAAQTKKLYIVKRPGLASLNTPRSGHIGNAVHIWTGQGNGTKVMSCFGNTNFKLFDGATDKGDGTGKARGITETAISSVATLVIASSDSTAWYYQDGGSLTQITDTDYPGNASRTTVGNFAHMDGYAFIMDSVGRVYNSDLNSIVNWTAASFVTANSIQDTGVGCVKHRNLIIAFCKEHFDVYRNAGNASGSPLSRVEEYSQRIGCVSAEAICELRDTIYFAGSTKGGNIAIYSYNGGQVQKVSTPEQDTALAIAGPSNITLSLGGLFGRHAVIVTASTSTYVFVPEENEWHEWTGAAQLWHRSDGSAAGTAIISYFVSKTSTSGKVYTIDPANVVWADDSQSYTASFQTSPFDGETRNYKFWKWLGIVADKETSASGLNCSYSDDDYQTQSTAKSLDLTSMYPRFRMGGRSRARSFLFAHSAATPMRLRFADIEYDAGAM
jgi:hypothetical protein